MEKTTYSTIAVITLIAALAFVITFTGCASDGDTSSGHAGHGDSGSHSSCH